jgi:hypothetical protein
MKYCNTGIINCKDCWDWDKDRCKVNLYNPNDKVAEAIATRDKWWVKRLQEFIKEDSDGDYHFYPTAEFHEWWQSLKQSLEVKE